MGALSGGITVKRFRVGGDPSEDSRERWLAGLIAHRFLGLGPDSEEDRAVGWCSIEHPLDTEFTYEKVFFGDYLCVAFRVDTIRIPAATLKAYVAERERRVLAESGRTSLGKSERKEIREVVRAELRRRVLPALRTVDLAWNLTTRRLFVWTQSRGLLEEMADAFERTFALPLYPEDAVAAARRLTAADLHVRIAEAEPSRFVSCPAGRDGWS